MTLNEMLLKIANKKISLGVAMWLPDTIDKDCFKINKCVYFYSHITRTACWLPPVENWGPSIELPFGWEKAVSGVLEPGQSYYIK